MSCQVSILSVGEDVVQASIDALTQRYALLPYLYSLFAVSEYFIVLW